MTRERPRRRHGVCKSALLLGLAALCSAEPTSFAQAAPPPASSPPNVPPQGASAPAPVAEPWSASQPSILADVRAGRPLVTRVFVPLCSNKQINCGASWAGSPAGLKANIYWGAQYGARRFFDREGSPWERVALSSGDGKPVLENAVYRRWVAGEPWGLPAGKRVEQLVVLTAIHGDRINQAVNDFWELAQSAEGSPSYFELTEGETTRRVRVHVAGYAGHNRLMDGVTLPPPKAPANEGSATEPRRGAPSFVLACYSEKYFSSALESVGSQRLVLTRTYMAPEGYVIAALVEALGDNRSSADVRRLTVEAYAKFQRLSVRTAGTIFSVPFAH